MIITIKGNLEYANSYLICRLDECILIDPANNFELIAKYLNGKKLTAIILTHAHADHFKDIDKFNIPIFVHKFDYDLLFMPRFNGLLNMGGSVNFHSLSIQLTDNNDKIKVADKFVTVIHTPGHTKGSICLLYDSNLFTGDLLFKNSVGRHDLYSGSIHDLKKSIVNIIDKIHPNTKIYPGHDESTTIRNEKKNPYYLKYKGK